MKKETFLLFFLTSILAAPVLSFFSPAISAAAAEMGMNSMGTTATNSTAGGNGNQTGGLPITTTTSVASSGNVQVSVNPSSQSAGSTVLVSATGLAHNSSVTITADDVVAGTTMSDEQGTVYFALGVPEKIEIRNIIQDKNNVVINDNVTTKTLGGNVKVVVSDAEGNSGFATLTITSNNTKGQTSTSSANTMENVDLCETGLLDCKQSMNGTNANGTSTSAASLPGNSTSAANMTKLNSTATNGTMPTNK
jgi:hypothetical protein